MFVQSIFIGSTALCIIHCNKQLVFYGTVNASAYITRHLHFRNKIRVLMFKRVHCGKR